MLSSSMTCSMTLRTKTAFLLTGLSSVVHAILPTRSLDRGLVSADAPSVLQIHHKTTHKTTHMVSLSLSLHAKTNAAAKGKTGTTVTAKIAAASAKSTGTKTIDGPKSPDVAVSVQFPVPDFAGLARDDSDDAQLFTKKLDAMAQQCQTQPAFIKWATDYALSTDQIKNENDPSEVKVSSYMSLWEKNRRRWSWLCGICRGTS